MLGSFSAATETTTTASASAATARTTATTTTTTTTTHPVMADLQVGVRVRYLGMRGPRGSAGVTVTVLRANDDGTYDVAPVDEVGTVVEGVPAKQLRKHQAKRYDSSGVMSNESFESDDSDGGEAKEVDSSATKEDAAARRIQSAHRTRVQQQQEEAAARRIQAAHRARTRDDDPAPAAAGADAEEAAARRIQAAHRARSPRGPTGGRFADEEHRAAKSNAAVNGILMSDDSADDDDGTMGTVDDDSVLAPLRSSSPTTKLDLRPLDPSSADFSSLQDTLDHLTDRVNDLTALANTHAEQLAHKDSVIRALYKKLKRTKLDAKKAMAKSYKHHASTFATLQHDLRGVHAQLAELQAEKAANIEIRDDLLTRVADNTRHIHENWKTIKHYRAQLDEKADLVDVTSKVEKADVIAFIEERQAAWEEVQSTTIVTNVTQQFSEVQHNVQQAITQQRTEVQVALQETRAGVEEKLGELSAKVDDAAQATEALGIIGADLQGGHQEQDQQLRQLKAAIDGQKRRLFEANVGDLHDSMGQVKQKLVTMGGAVEEENAKLKGRVSALEEQLEQRLAQVESLHSQLATLAEQQEEAATKQEELRERAQEQQREQVEREELLRQAVEQQIEETRQLLQQKTARRKGARGRGRAGGAGTRRAGGGAESKTNGRPHTSGGRSGGSGWLYGVPDDTNRGGGPVRPALQRSELEMDGDMIVGTRVTIPSGSSNNSHDDGGGGGGGNGSVGGDSVDRVASLEQRMSHAVEVLAETMGRLERNINHLADSDPLRRAGFKLATHESTTDTTRAYNASTARYARERHSTVVKIGDRGDALRFEKGAPPAAGKRGGRGGAGSPYKLAGEDHLVDIHNGRNTNGTWAFSAPQVTFRQKETRELAQRGRQDTPMRHQLGRDPKVNLMQQDAS